MVRVVTRCINNPLRVFLVVAAWLLSTGAGFHGLGISADTRVFFSDQNPTYVDLLKFEKTYEQNNNILFVIRKEGQHLLAKETLHAIKDLTEAAWQLPLATRADSVTNFPHISSDEDGFLVAELFETIPDLDTSERRHYENTISSEPALINRLVASDFKTFGVNVQFLLPEDASSDIKTIVKSAQTLADRIEEAYPGIEIHLTGNVMLQRTFSIAAMNDVYVLLPIAMIVIAGLLMLTLRSIASTLSICLLLAISSISVLGMYGWAGHELNVATVVAPVVIMVLSMAGSVHLVSHMQINMSRGREKFDAILDSCRDNLKPVFLMSLTTAIGFLSMNLADAPPLHDLGNMVVIGIAINFILTFTVLPLLLNKLDIPPKPPLLAGSLAHLATWVRKYALSISVLGIIAMSMIAAGAAKIALDNDYIRYFDKRFDYRIASDHAEDKLTGLNFLEFDFPAGGERRAFDPAYQKNLKAFTDWLKAQDKVSSVTSIVDITEKVDKAMNPEKAKGTIPNDTATIAQYFLLYEMSLPFGMDITDQMNVSRSSSRVTALLRHASSRDIRQIKRKAESWVAENLPSEMDSTAVSINVVFAYLSMINIQSMLLGTAISFLIISIIIGIALKSISLGFLSLVTNVMPATIGFGIWGFFFQEINLAGSVIVAITLGIVVDDTIHFLNRYKKQRDAGVAPADAIEQVIRTTGTAMSVTTFSVAAGFAVLTLSGFSINNTLGAFTGIIILVALVVDLVILPAFLSLFAREKASPSA